MFGDDIFTSAFIGMGMLFIQHTPFIIVAIALFVFTLIVANNSALSVRFFILFYVLGFIFILAVYLGNGLR